MPIKKTDDFGFITSQRRDHRNGKINPKSKNYDPYLAERRKKEKNRRKVNQQKRNRKR